VVILVLTTLGVKRKLDSQFLECRIHEAIESLDLRIYVELSKSWDKKGYWEVSGGISGFGALVGFARRIR